MANVTAVATKPNTHIPCILMRGGTSRGPFFLESDLPSDPVLRDRVLLAVMGSPHVMQVDGIGGSQPQTSKVAIVGQPTHPDADVDYLFAQVSVDRALVDTAPNCGNMLSGVAPFAIEAGLVAAQRGETVVRIYNRNTRSLIDAMVQTPGGFVTYDGDTTIDGVADAAAPIKLSFLDATGSKTGALLPTGQRIDIIDRHAVTLIDYAMPMMLLAAADFGLSGTETADELNANHALFARLESLRRQAGLRMGLGDVAQSVIPKVGLLSCPRHGGTITSRYLVPDRCHRSHAVTGALCIAAASRLPETVAHAIAQPSPLSPVTIEHPGGRIQVDLVFSADGNPARASLMRTARRIFEGRVIVPAKTFTQANQKQSTGSHVHDLTASVMHQPARSIGDSAVI